MCLAVPGQVIALFEADGMPMAKVSFGGVVKGVCLVYLPELQVGDYALVHVGFAISQVDQVTAQATLRLFEELGVIEEELQELRTTDSPPVPSPPKPSSLP